MASEAMWMTQLMGKKQQHPQHHHNHHHLCHLHLAMKTWGLRSSFTSVIAFLVATVIFLTLTLSFRGANQVETERLQAAGRGERSSSPTCDLSSGRWVHDNSSYPLYSERECMFMSDQLACGKFGRSDVKYQQWRWQPDGCDLPRFNATALLERLRGKRMVFVGDSLNRGQWVSMICLLGSVIPAHQKSMQTNGSLIAFKAQEYNASVEFYWAPLVVESNSDDPVNHRLPERIIRAQSIEKHARHWTDADVLVFNSYLWWRRPQMEVLWGSFEDPHGIHKKIEMLRSFELALQTWAEWLEFHVDRSKTRMFFMSMSPTHFWADEWGKSEDQNCYNETEPITKTGHQGRDSDQKMARVVESTIEGLHERGVKVHMINITQLSEYRKDGHPSIYRKQWEPLTETQIAKPSSYADCIHWCLPGVPDVWNELLYAYIFSQ